jgi:ATP adenylyltransferase
VFDRLFTPWRMAYVTSQDDAGAGCALCRARDGAGTAERLVVHRGERCFVVMNLYPYTSGHVMVTPNRHVGSLVEATPEELSELMALARRLEQAFREEYKPDGVNLGMNLGRAAGAGIADHIHMHVVPRWSGDTSFMTVVSGTRVLPETPEQACERLRKRFA